MDLVDRIYVKRLREYLDPWQKFGWVPTDVAIVNAVETFVEDERDFYYDLGRIKFFREQLNQGVVLDPIELDCRCDRGFCYADPVILDGWHRFAAHILANIEIIEVNFGGRVDLLDYLTGKSNEKPEQY